MPGEGGARKGTVVIGLGNPLMGDDGVGLAALEALRGGWRFEPWVEMLDGGTWGVNLLPAVEGAERVLVLDAIRGGSEPGEVVTLEGDEIPRFLSTKLSPHQIDFREVLALAELRGTLPPVLLALGVQPDRVEMRVGLSPRAAAGLPRLVETCVERLRGWGHIPRRAVAVDA